MRAASGRSAGAKRVRQFYAAALEDADRALLEAAEQVEGLDAEIALLRPKLLLEITEHPDNLDVLLPGVRLLVQAVATRYRISGQAKDDLLQSVVGVLEGVGAALLPPEPGDGQP